MNCSIVQLVTTNKSDKVVTTLSNFITCQTFNIISTVKGVASIIGLAVFACFGLMKSTIIANNLWLLNS